MDDSPSSPSEPQEPPPVEQVLSPSLQDYCAWRKTVLKRKAKKHDTATTPEGDRQLEAALNLGTTAASQLASKGLGSEVRRVGDMKARLVVHSYAEAGVVQGKAPLWPSF